jgi:recombinational DNA repair ATPase RecF
MSAFSTVAVVSVVVAAFSIALLMLDDVFAELDRRRREDVVFASARRRVRRHP